MGHQVRIIGADQSHIRAIQPNLNGKKSFQESVCGVKYTWFKTPAYVGSGIGRIRNMIGFLWRLFIEGPKIVASFEPDVVIASSTYPMDIWPAHYIAKRSKAILVFEVHDLWPLSPMELGGFSRWHPFIMLVQAAENYAYRHAEVVVSMLPKVRDHVELHGMLPHKLHIVPNGIDPDEWSNNSLPLGKMVRDELTGLKDQGFLIVGYAGTHGIANALDTLLDAARLMLDEKVIFVLVGGGPEKKLLQARAGREKLSNVRFMEPVPKQQIPSLLEFFDIAYLGFQKQPLFRFGIAPNKLMDYMMAGKVVLMAIAAGNDPVAEANCGLTVEPENPNAVVEGIKRLLKLTQEERTSIGQRGSVFMLKHHTYRVLSQRFLAALTPSPVKS